MKTSQSGIDLIKQWEGFRAKAYKDTGGVWTVGYGHTSDSQMAVGASTVVTQAQAESLLRGDLAEAENAVSRLVKVTLSQSQFDALVSFTYNLGEGQLQKSTLLKKLNTGDYQSVPSELQKWVYDNGKKQPGLVNRRAAEAGLWVKGDFVSSKTTPSTKPASSVTMSPEILGSVGVPVAGAALTAASQNNILAYAVGFVIVVTALVVGYILWKKQRA